MTLLYFLGDYMVPTLKNGYIRNEKSDHETINEFNYIISTQRVVRAHNATHLLVWFINLVLLQIQKLSWF
jgi:hypothetical protein